MGFWGTEIGSCIHFSKVKERIPKKEFDKLYKEFNNKQTKKEKVNEPLPKLSDILSEVIDVYSKKTSVEEIIGALEMCKNRTLSLHKTKKIN